MPRTTWGQFGGIPTAEYIKKMELTPVYEDPDELDQFRRDALRYDGPDEALFDYEEPRRLGSMSTQRIHLRTEGRLSDKQPDHSEMFFGITGKDPRGFVTDPDFKKMRAQAEARSRFFEKKLYNDACPSVPEQIMSEPVAIKNQKLGYYDTKRRLKIFDTAFTGTPHGHAVPTKYDLRPQKYQVRDYLHPDFGHVGDLFTRQPLNQTQVLSNIYPMGWYRSTDHKFSVSKYGLHFTGQTPQVNDYMLARYGGAVGDAKYGKAQPMANSTGQVPNQDQLQAVYTSADTGDIKYREQQQMYVPKLLAKKLGELEKENKKINHNAQLDVKQGMLNEVGEVNHITKPYNIYPEYHASLLNQTERTQKAPVRGYGDVNQNLVHKPTSDQRASEGRVQMDLVNANYKTVEAMQQATRRDAKDVNLQDLREKVATVNQKMHDNRKNTVVKEAIYHIKYDPSSGKWRKSYVTDPRNQGSIGKRTVKYKTPSHIRDRNAGVRNGTQNFEALEVGDIYAPVYKPLNKTNEKVDPDLVNIDNNFETSHQVAHLTAPLGSKYMRNFMDEDTTMSDMNELQSKESSSGPVRRSVRKGRVAFSAEKA